MDFLKVQPNNRLQQLDNLSNSGSSQASSTVINPDFKDESQKITSNLNSMSLQTIDINEILNKKNKEQQLAQINQRELMQQKQLQLQQQQKQQQAEAQAQAQAQLQLQQKQQQEQLQLQQQAQQEQYMNYEDAEVEPEIEVDPEEDEDDDYFDDDKLNDYINGMLPSPPSSPPRELDPNKLYALYDFSGPDPSHLELQKDASVVLLNDSDSYWWLVKRLQDGVVGFAPAEILETYGERLARLNCWKNEVIERNQNGEDVGTYLSQDDLKTFELNSQRKYHNSVAPGSTGAGAGRQLGLGGTHGRSSSLNSFDNSGISSGSGGSGSSGSNPNSKSDLSLARKSSLKRSKSAIKKSVTFVPEALHNLQEIEEDPYQDQDADITDTETENDTYPHHPQPQQQHPQQITQSHSNALSTTNNSAYDRAESPSSQPLIVPKRTQRVSNSNFIVKNLDDYQPGGPDDTVSLVSATSATSATSGPNSSNSDVDSILKTPSMADDQGASKTGRFGRPLAGFMSTNDSIGSYSPIQVGMVG
ncbi:unnamed protein product [Ambrosiozyma monospora]|uniref:Unnamed protein product n=1 Tax=Ambrosiozyma monospora TaxID=43982 RepID=A0ACB5TIX1_AMBMO|nr:unnamed protein product [Ambrosiozyma monospora]